MCVELAVGESTTYVPASPAFSNDMKGPRVKVGTKSQARVCDASLGKGKMSCMRSCYSVDVLLGCISPCRRSLFAFLTGNFCPDLNLSCVLRSLLLKEGRQVKGSGKGDKAVKRIYSLIKSGHAGCEYVLHMKG